MPRLGGPEIIVISILIIVFFGSKRLPEFIKAIGLSIKEFKKSMNDN